GVAPKPPEERSSQQQHCNANENRKRNLSPPGIELPRLQLPRACPRTRRPPQRSARYSTCSRSSALLIRHGRIVVRRLGFLLGRNCGREPRPRFLSCMRRRSRQHKRRNVLQLRLHPADPLIDGIEVNLKLQAVQL